MGDPPHPTPSHSLHPHTSLPPWHLPPSSPCLLLPPERPGWTSPVPDPPLFLLPQVDALTRDRQSRDQRIDILQAWCMLCLYACVLGLWR